ncbi:MAG: dihydropteroate synthase [Gammaproteobacteria bacterium]
MTGRRSESGGSEGGGFWRCGAVCFDLHAPLIMGIVNTTPDSFSDGGSYASADDAVRRGLLFADEGAAIVDVGGESTRPGAAVVSAEEEKKRILPVIERLAARGIVVSADTQKPEVMRAALAAGASVINDIGGMGDEKSRAIAADSDCGVIIMHMRGSPQTMQTMTGYEDVAAQVGGFLRRRARMLVDDGIDKARLCADPGIGFGKTPAQNWRMLRELPAMIGEGLPILIGASRKSLFAEIEPDAKKRDGISAVLATLLYARRAANIFRVHNVAATKAALAVASVLECEDGN